jgi:hypothetical protein
VKIYSINQNGEFNMVFYKLLAMEKLKNIQQCFSFEINVVVLEGEYCAF